MIIYKSVRIGIRFWFIKYDIYIVQQKGSAMKLIMHDLPQSDFKKIIPSTDPDTTVIFDNGKIHACIGCFGCWIKTPGVCVIKDGYQNLGEMFSKSDEIIVISRCIYGTYSPFIKNIWDRSIAYLLPYFTKKNNETHHKMRYDHNFKLTVHFYGDDLTRNEIDTAQKFVKANCVNFATVPEIYFHEAFEEIGGKKCEYRAY
jgi:multimeric flavodoxin WrbA